MTNYFVNVAFTRFETSMYRYPNKAHNITHYQVGIPNDVMEALSVETACAAKLSMVVAAAKKNKKVIYNRGNIFFFSRNRIKSNRLKTSMVKLPNNSKIKRGAHRLL